MQPYHYVILGALTLANGVFAYWSYRMALNCCDLRDEVQRRYNEWVVRLAEEDEDRQCELCDQPAIAVVASLQDGKAKSILVCKQHMEETVELDNEGEEWKE